MKKKFLWLLLSFLLVASLVLASCAKEVVAPGEQEEEEEVVAPGEEEEEEVVVPEAGEPQYGGTLTVWGSGQQFSDPPDPSVAHGNYSALYWLDYIQEGPIIGNTEKYGPRGTDEYKFQLYSYIPEKYIAGHLVESWNLSLEQLVCHVRPGIYWQDVPGVMEAREFTAEDLVYDWIGYLESPWNLRFKGFINVDDAPSVVYATDRYTVVVKFLKYSPALFMYFAYEDRCLISPPETDIAGAERWENQVGTGPFMFEEYVTGSHMSFKRNPNYWKTTTINGVIYQLPFADRVVVPILPDVATQYAALRTGKLDIFRGVAMGYWGTLDKISEMQMVAYTSGTGSIIWMRCDQPPFDNVKVRQAVRIGTNTIEFMRLAKAEALSMDWWPVHPDNPAVYTPLKELPADIQELWKYDPVKAKRMLAEAGYPEGFKTKLLVTSTPMDLDIAALLKSQWAKIGIEVEIDARELAAVVAEKYPTPVPRYKGLCIDGTKVADPFFQSTQMLYYPSGYNYPVYNNPAFNAMSDTACLKTDPAERDRLIRELSLVLMRDSPGIPLYFIPERIYWWPWVKNYYGEATIADDGRFAPLTTYMWIDQVLKKEMGYKYK